MADRSVGRAGSIPQVVHVGSACRDETPDDPRGWRLGGGVAYAALTTARLGLRTVAVIGVDEAARTAHELDLIRAAGAELLLVPLAEGPVYRNLETPDGRVQTCLQVGRPLPIPVLPPAWLAAPAWQLAPVADEIGDAWADVVPAGTDLALAWQGLLRELRAGQRVTRRPPRPSSILSRADVVAVSHHDLDPETPIARLTAMLRPGARLVITRGRDGGLVVDVGAAGPEAVVRYSTPPSADELDPTGAGDVFLAALVAARVDPKLLAAAPGADRPELRFAAAAAGLVVEGPGLAAVADRAATVARMVADAARPFVTPSVAGQVGA